MNDGGSAFPRALSATVERGMSLRDYFASKAIQGSIMVSLDGETYPKTGQWSVVQIAKRAYLMADAMITERTKSGGGV